MLSAMVCLFVLFYSFRDWEFFLGPSITALDSRALTMAFMSTVKVFVLPYHLQHLLTALDSEHLYQPTLSTAAGSIHHCQSLLSVASVPVETWVFIPGLLIFCHCQLYRLFSALSTKIKDLTHCAYHVYYVLYFLNVSPSSLIFSNSHPLFCTQYVSLLSCAIFF